MENKSRAQGKWEVWQTFAKGCTVQLMILIQQFTGKFAVSLLHLDHNHEIPRQQFQLYPDQRRPTGYVADEVDSMLSVNGKRTLVAKVLHSQRFV